MLLASLSRKIGRFYAAGLLLFSAGMSLAQPSPDGVAESTRVELILTGEPGFRQAGYYAALWKGYFAEADLDVVLRYAEEGEVVVDTVLVEPGVYAIGGEAFFEARMRELPVVLLAAIQQETPQALRLRGDGGRGERASLLDLAGSGIALRPGAESAPLRRMLRRMGAGETQATWLDWPDGTEPPTAAQWVQGDVFEGDLAWVRPADQGVVAFYGDSLFASEAELAYHPQRVTALRAAVLRGWRSALSDTGGMIEEIMRHSNEIGLERSRASLWYEAEIARGLIKPATVELGQAETARVQEIGHAMVELGLVDAAWNLQNFLYRPPGSGLPRWVYGIGIGLVLATLVALGVIWFNVRLQRRVHDSTRRLRESQERYREMLQHAPVAIVEEDYSGVVEWIRERRTEGVTDLAAWLDTHPEDVTRQYEKVSAVRANRAALELVGVEDVASYARCLAANSNESLQVAFREELLALWRGFGCAGGDVLCACRRHARAWTVAVDGADGGRQTGLQPRVGGGDGVDRFAPGGRQTAHQRGAFPHLV